IIFARSGRLEDVTAKGYRSLCEFQVAGAPTNIPFLQALLLEEAVRAGAFDTGFVEVYAPALTAMDAAAHPRPHAAATEETKRGPRAGARIDAGDPLSVLGYGQSGDRARPARSAAAEDLAAGMVAIRTPLQGTVIAIAVAVGDEVPAGTEVAVMEAMKME